MVTLASESLWDPNEEAPKDAEAARLGSADAASVAALAQGVSEALSSRLVSYHRRVGGGWDPNERFPNNIATNARRPADAASVTRLAQGSGTEDCGRGPPTQGMS